MNPHQRLAVTLFGVIVLLRVVGTGYLQHAFTSIIDAVSPVANVKLP